MALRASWLIVVVGCGSNAPSSHATPTSAPAAPSAETSSRQAPLAAETVAEVAPPPTQRTKWAPGNTVAIHDGDGLSDAQTKLKASGCRPWTEDTGAFPKEWGKRDVWDFDVGTVADVVRCSDGEFVLLDVHGVRTPIVAEELRATPPGCPAAVRAMHDTLLPKFQPCFDSVPPAWRGGHITTGVTMTFDETGAVKNVEWLGSTGWGRKAALCILDAAKKAKLDGSECKGVVVRIAKSFAKVR